MDVGRIQKINNLALDLMRQGLASDREQAVAQAEKIFRGQDAEEYHSMQETMKEVQADAKEEPAQKAEEQAVSETMETPLSPDEIKEILGKNTEFVVKKMKEFQDKIASLGREIDSLKTQLTYKNLPTVKEIVSQKEQEKQTAVHEQETSEQKTESTEKKETSSTESHPRSGSYNEDDVSIEKFFYMGKG